MPFFSCCFNLFFFNPRAAVYRKVELDGIISLLGCHVSVSVPLALAQLSMFSEQKWTDSLEVSFSATYILWQRRLNKELTGFVKGHNQKTALGKQSSVFCSVAPAFHTGKAGDMSCEWIECEASSYSSGNIILSLASLCLFCVCLVLPCY